ncbi:YtxH domain-containing protein [Weeksellaceae bacterium TAE3-ERU29]|nr:YtxH domain-containing protein [Weeksellaceae bacterium TAE3-ERU29]
MSKAKQTGALIGSLLIGALAGGVAALLLAPQSGDETIKQLNKKAKKLRKEIDNYASDMSDKAVKVKKDLEAKLKKTESDLKEMEEDLGV